MIAFIPGVKRRVPLCAPANSPPARYGYRESSLRDVVSGDYLPIETVPFKYLCRLSSGNFSIA